MIPPYSIVETKGIKYIVFDIKDSINSAIKYNGEFALLEREICKVFILNNRLKEGVVLDIGANLGSFSLPLSKIKEADSINFMCFEPQKIVFQQLCGNVILNQSSNIQTYNIALGERSGILNIPQLDLANSDNVGGYSLDETIRRNREEKPGFSSRNSYTGEIETVDLKTLDSYEIKKNIIFMKIDVEGNELEVIKGAYNTFKQHSFPPILFEVWDHIDWYKDKAIKTKNALLDMNYELIKIGENYLAQHKGNKSYIDVKINNGRITFG